MNENNETPNIDTQNIVPETTPVAPVAPVESAAPVAPVVPETPAEPVAPATPAEPIAPVTPASPAEPIAPAAPVEPVAPATPVTPVTTDAPAATTTAAPTEKKPLPKWVLPVAIGGGVLLIAIIVGIVIANNNAKKVTQEANDIINNTIKTVEGDNIVIGSNDNDLVDPEELTKNISSAVSQTKEGTLVIVITNKNEQVVNLDVDVEFYKKDGTFVDSASTYTSALEGNGEAALEISDVPDYWDTYKVFIEANNSSYISYASKIKLTDNDSGAGVTASYTNNLGVDINSLEVAIVYYSGKEVVGYDSEFEYDLKNGRSVNLEFFAPHDGDYNKVMYDSYKIYINEAYILGN